MKSEQCLNLIDFVEMSSRQEKDFQAKVAANKGIVPVLVHPFFQLDLPEQWRAFKTAPGYEDRCQQYIEACLAYGLPLIIFQEQAEVYELANKIKPSSISTLYVVETLAANPTPITGNLGWRKIVDNLKAASTRKAVVGGMYMELLALDDIIRNSDNYYQIPTIIRAEKYQRDKTARVGIPRWLENGLYPECCAGYTIRRLHDDGISTAVSSVSSPCYRLEPINLNACIA